MIDERGKPDQGQRRLYGQLVPPECVQRRDRVLVATEHRSRDGTNRDTGDRHWLEAGSGLVERCEDSVLVGPQRATSLKHDRGRNLASRCRHGRPPESLMRSGFDPPPNPFTALAARQLDMELAPRRQDQPFPKGW